MSDIAAQRPAAGAPIESAWGGQIHDALEGMQSGVVPFSGATQSVAASVPIVFPRAYSAPPLMLVTCSSHRMAANATGVTATGCTLSAQRLDGSAASATGTITWLSIGEPA